MKILNPSQFTSTFFGLTSEQALISRKNLFTYIHEIVFHGNGGYNWHTVYNMPVWLRNFTYSEISNFHQKQNEEAEKIKSNSTKQKTAIGPDGKIDPSLFPKPTKSSYK